jgi:preprotein translocase subunit SecD
MKNRLTLLLLVLVAAPGSRQRPELPVLGIPGRGGEVTTATAARRVLFELRLAEPEPVRGLTFEGTVKNSDRKTHLHYTVVISNVDVMSATAMENGGHFDVVLSLRPEGAQKMSEATSKHIGRPVAIVLDGELVALVTVRQPFSNRLVFGADFTADEARRIASGLERW